LKIDAGSIYCEKKGEIFFYFSASGGAKKHNNLFVFIGLNHHAALRSRGQYENFFLLGFT
jgi:hypothetical protein